MRNQLARAQLVTAQAQSEVVRVASWSVILGFIAQLGSEVCAVQSQDGPNPNFVLNTYTRTIVHVIIIVNHKAL